MTDKEYRDLLAENIVRYRKESGMTQLELAEHLQYSNKSISKWERGESAPDIITLIHMAELFGVSVDDLVYGEKAKQILHPQGDAETGLPQAENSAAVPGGDPHASMDMAVKGTAALAKVENISLAAMPRSDEVRYMIAHIVGGGFASAATVMCIVRAVLSHSRYGLAAAIILGVTMVLYYMLSSIKYGIVASMRVKKIFEVICSSAQYLMYTGVYTVFTLCTIGPEHPTLGWIYLVAIWGLDMIGIALTLANVERYRYVTVIFWGIIIWSILPFYNIILASIGNLGAGLLTAGILISTLSLACFALEYQRRWLHFLSTIFTILGSLFYFICIYNNVI